MNDKEKHTKSSARDLLAQLKKETSNKSTYLK